MWCWNILQVINACNHAGLHRMRSKILFIVRRAAITSMQQMHSSIIILDICLSAYVRFRDVAVDRKISTALYL